MFKKIIILLLTFYTGSTYASCYGNAISYGAPISVDLSDKLTPASPEWTGSYTTQYSGSFSCTTKNSEFGYTSILNTNDTYATILGFSGDKYKIRAEITNPPANTTLASSGSHTASELNVPMTIRFRLVSNASTATIDGDTASLSDVLFVTDLSGMSILEIIGWPLKQIVKIFTWLFNGFKWPYDNRDMYGQPLIIKYAPKLTTCSFYNAGLSVTLPTLGISQVLRDNRPGYTPFNLNMRCDDMETNGTSDRSIDMFLSSTTLHSTDATILIDSSGASGSAQGLGLRLVKRDALDTPITISSSPSNKGSATSLFSVAAGGALDANFSIPMAVYYQPWDRSGLTQGTINTTATLNIIYP